MIDETCIVGGLPIILLQVETRATGIEREKTEGRDVEHLGTTVS